jgi:AraC family transcriptional regulator
LRQGLSFTLYLKRCQVPNSIEFIESNLQEELALSDVSRQANASLYHFHRLFKVFTGQTLKVYIRSRRLTHAAHDLTATKKSVIEIALDYGYSAPESFLRAFKAFYGTTPREFRKRGVFLTVHAKADLLNREISVMQGVTIMNPRFEQKSRFNLYGNLIHTRHGSCKAEVHGFWARMHGDGHLDKLARKAEADAIYGVCFGVCDGCGSAIEEDAEQFPYLIGWEAAEGSPLPEGLVEMSVPGGKYAVFTVEGDDREIQRTIDRIYGSWLPASSHELADSPVLEKYGIDWTGKEGSVMEIWLPIK